MFLDDSIAQKAEGKKRRLRFFDKTSQRSLLRSVTEKVMMSEEINKGEDNEMRSEKISFELLRTLAAEAWDLGETDRAAFFAQPMDSAMLSALQHDEGGKVGTDKVPLIVSADRA